jgi:hypothetical protein
MNGLLIVKIKINQNMEPLKRIIFFSSMNIIILACSDKPKEYQSTDEIAPISIVEPSENSKGEISGDFGGCGYNYTSSQKQIELSQPGQRELHQIDLILKFSGLSSNFKVFSAPIENAVATIVNNQRFILYDPELLSYTDQQSGNYWTSMSILAHEIGHHLSGHTITNTGSNPADELEADKFSGFVLFKLGASLTQATAAIEKLGSQEDTYSHPSKYKRIQSITTGWKDAAEQRYESAVPPPPVDEENNVPFWGQEEFPKEELICPDLLSSNDYGGVINRYQHPFLEGIIIDITKEDPTRGNKAEFCNQTRSEFNMIVTIQLTKVSPSPFSGPERKVGQREKFYLTEYFQMNNAAESALEAIMTPGRLIRFQSFYFGYGAEDIFYIKKLNRNGSNQVSKNQSEESNGKIRINSNYIVINERAYFYVQPDLSYKKNSYLVYGESIYGEKIQNGFIYTNFVNPKGQLTSGWIYLNDLSER